MAGQRAVLKVVLLADLMAVMTAVLKVDPKVAHWAVRMAEPLAGQKVVLKAAQKVGS